MSVHPDRQSSAGFRTYGASAYLGDGGDGRRCRYRALRTLGVGTYGLVLLAEDVMTGEKVAIKQVRCDPQMPNREVQILQYLLLDDDGVPQRPGSPSSPTRSTSSASATRGLPGFHSSPTSSTPNGPSTFFFLRYHPNIIRLRASFVAPPSANGILPIPGDDSAAYFHTSGGGAGSSQLFLHMVMSYVPMDLHTVKAFYLQHRQFPLDEATCSRTGLQRPSSSEAVLRSPKLGSSRLPISWVKVVLFQLARALAYAHAHNICHRDLKPSNVLVDPTSAHTELCDFGSAKQIIFPESERNVSYICSRYYRAPELLFGALHYGCEVDMWSYGCIVAELHRESGRPLFKGCSSVDQMAEIFKVLGAPSQQEMNAMNPRCAEALRRTHAMHYSYTDGNDDFSRQLAQPGSLPSTLPHDGLSNDEEDAVEHDDVRSSVSAAARRRTFGDYCDVLQIRAIPLVKLFPPDTPSDALDLVSALLCYDPRKRLSAVDVVQHPFFDDLFTASDEAGETDIPGSGAAVPPPSSTSSPHVGGTLRLPNGSAVPDTVFRLTQKEARLYTAAFKQKMMREADACAASY